MELEPSGARSHPVTPVLDTAFKPPRKTREITLVKSQTKRGVFILLGLLIGPVGAHNLYAGYITRAMVELAVGLIGILFILGSNLPGFGVSLLIVIQVGVILELCAVTRRRGRRPNGLKKITRSHEATKPSVLQSFVSSCLRVRKTPLLLLLKSNT